MSEELSECPFPHAPDSQYGPGVIWDRAREKWRVQCFECYVNGPLSDTPKQAIAAWNRRADGWRSMESAPKDGKPFFGLDAEIGVGTFYYNPPSDTFEECGKIPGWSMMTLHYWMPIPPTPKGG